MLQYVKLRTTTQNKDDCGKIQKTYSCRGAQSGLFLTQSIRGTICCGLRDILVIKLTIQKVCLFQKYRTS